MAEVEPGRPFVRDRGCDLARGYWEKGKDASDAYEPWVRRCGTSWGPKYFSH